MNGEHQFLNICKICKKVYKDKGGLVDHQRVQHSNNHYLHQLNRFQNFCNTESIISENTSNSNQQPSPQQSLATMDNNKGRFSKEIQQQNRRVGNGNFTRNFTGKEERFNKGEQSNGNGSVAGAVNKAFSRLESYATLQKPPASLKPKLQQSRAMQLSKEDSNAEEQSSNKSFEDNDGEQDGWAKWEPEKERDLEAEMIITASVAQSTAACYNPTGQSPSFKDILKNDTGLVNNSGAVATAEPAASTIKPKIILSEKKSTPGKITIHHNQQTILATTTAGKLPAIGRLPPIPTLSGGSFVKQSSGGLSPNKGFGRLPIPKLMSKTKAQFQILKSQATRPKIVPRNATNNALPRTPNQPPTGSRVASAPTNKGSSIDPPKLMKQADLPSSTDARLSHQNPPQLLRELSLESKGSEPQAKDTKSFQQCFKPTRGRGAGRGAVAGRGSPPRTKARASMDPHSITSNEDSIPVRGRPRGRGVQVQGRGGQLQNRGGQILGRGQVPRRGGHLQGRGGPPRTSSVVRRESLQSPSEGSEEDSVDSNSNGNRANTEEEEADFGPPPPKKPAKEPIIYGKGYRCPSLDKKASYLDNKGVRIWICLVCERAEEEISGGPMICCDLCEDWYHFTCVGIDVEPPEEEKWFCKRCLFKNLKTHLVTEKPGKRGRKKGGAVGRGSNRPRGSVKAKNARS